MPLNSPLANAVLKQAWGLTLTPQDEVILAHLDKQIRDYGWRAILRGAEGGKD